MNTHTLTYTVLLWRGEQAESDILILCTKVLSGIQDKYNDPEHLSIISGFSTCRLQFCLFYYLVCYFALLHITTYHIIPLIKVLYCCASTHPTPVGTSQLKVPLTNISLTHPYSQALWTLCLFFLFSSTLCQLLKAEADSGHQRRLESLRGPTGFQQA